MIINERGLFIDFGKNLRKLRMAKNLTQEQVAGILNVSAQSVSRWECSTSYPDVIILPEITGLYCVTVDDLFKDNSVSYENYAHRLLSLYEDSGKQEDFINADREYSKLLRSGNCTMKWVLFFL